MRPFIVLLIVAAAAGGLFFALQNGSDSNGGSTGDQSTITRQAADEGAKSEGDDVELAGVTEVNQREAGKITAQPTIVANEGSDMVDPVAGVGELIGRVVDEKGTPIAEANVTLTLFGAQAFLFGEVDRSKDVQTVTGDDGRYIFVGVPVRDGYSVIADHADYSKAELPNIIVIEGRESEVPDITLTPGSRVRGRITDTGGAFVKGARLLLSENRFDALLDTDSGSSKYETVSDTEGNFEILNVAPMQNYSLSVSADGYGSVQISPLAVVAREDTVQEIVLEVAAMMGGAVTSSLGEPIEGASVEAWATDRTKRSTHTRVATDELGEFIFDDIPTGEFQLIVRHPKFAANATTKARSGDMSVAIRLEPLPTISGQVVDGATGAPLTRFQVQIRTPIQGSTTGATQAVNTSKTTFEDPEGRFELTAPKGGTYIVEGMAPGYADTYSDPFETVMNQSATGIVVRMTRGAVLTGRVLGVGGVPLAGAIVETHDKEWSSDPFGQMLIQSGIGEATDTKTTTNEEGVYRLENLKGAEYQLRFRHRDYASTTKTNIRLVDGAEMVVPDVRLPRGAQVSGVVYGPSGAPLASAQVQMVPMVAGIDVLRTQTGSTGEFELKNVPEGRYKISAQRPQDAQAGPFGGSIDLKRTERELVVREGQNVGALEFKISDR